MDDDPVSPPRSQRTPYTQVLKTNFTLKRQDAKHIEMLMLCEAFGCWMSDLFNQEIRGADGFMEDVRDGVHLCALLQRVGIPCELPKSPRNPFEAKENRLKYQSACERAEFSAIPGMDMEDAWSLLPSLLEIAAVAEAKMAREGDGMGRKVVKLPDAIIKRTGDLGSSKAVQNAMVEAPLIGKTTRMNGDGLQNVDSPGVVSSGTVSQENPNVVVGAAQVGPVIPSSRKASGLCVVLNATASPAVQQRKTATSMKDGEVVPARPITRATSEISTQEKDQMMSLFFGGIVFALVVLYVLSQLF